MLFFWQRKKHTTRMCRLHEYFLIYEAKFILKIEEEEEISRNESRQHLWQEKKNNIVRNV